MDQQVHVIDHPLIQHKLSIMRNQETGSKDFRLLLTEISMLMGYELSRDLELEDYQIDTPICHMTTAFPVLATQVTESSERSKYLGRRTFSNYMLPKRLRISEPFWRYAA